MGTTAMPWRGLGRSDRSAWESVWIAALTLPLVHAGEAVAQSYPTKPVRVIVPLAPGGGNDTLARFMAKPLTEALGQQIVVENRPGGGGLIGGEFVARAAPDGYTLVVAGSGLLVVTLAHRKLDMQKDLEPIAVIGEYASLLVVHPSLPVKSVRELVAFAKARPGALNYGTAGIGSAGHLVTEMFRNRAGLDMVHVPYKGAGPALTELVAGQVSMLLSNPMGSKALVEAGRLRPLAVSSPKRLVAFPDVPTLAEAGLPGFSSTFFLGLMGPAGLPREIVARLNKETVSVLQRREIREWLETRGMEAVGGTPEDFAGRIRSDIEAMSKVIRDTGLQLK